MIIWRGESEVPEIQCASSVLAEIAELAMSGYRRYPWGGVEIGGLLFGKNKSGIVYICASRVAECEHHYGPAFDLSTNDCGAFEQLLTNSPTDQKLAGLTPVGWYQSSSRRDSGLSENARAVFQRFFPEPWQVAMVLKRSKNDPLTVEFFVRDLKGGIELQAPGQEFTLDFLRQRRQPADSRE
jgi:hypothetical protein